MATRGNIDIEQIKAADRTGTGLKLATSTGSLTSGHAVSIDASGNMVDSGAAPGTGTVTHTGGALTAHLLAVGNGGADIETPVPIGTAGQYLRSGGAATDPAFASIAGTEVAAATSSVRGTVTPDGTIITVTAGAITVPKASSSVFGVVEVDNVTITAAAGVISAVGGTGTVTHTGALTLDQPVFGNGSADIKVGTKTGNTDVVATATGVTTASVPLIYDASGNVIVGSRTGNTTQFVSATGADTSGYPLLYDASGNAVARQPRGNTTVVQLADVTTNPTTGDLAKFDANGNIADAGVLASAILSNPMTTKGDVIVGATSGVPARLAVGSNGQVLMANSAATNGIDWEAPISLTTTGTSGAASFTPGNPSVLNIPQYASGGGGSGALTQIAQTVLGASASSITFAAIAGSYTDLILVVSGRTDEVAASSNCYIQFNADTGANYGRQLWASIGTASVAPAAKAPYFAFPAASATANLAGQMTLTMVNYARTVFDKDGFCQFALRTDTTTGAATMGYNYVTWNNNAAITQILIAPVTGTAKFITGTVATLYGRL